MKKAGAFTLGKCEPDSKSSVVGRTLKKIPRQGFTIYSSEQKLICVKKRLKAIRRPTGFEYQRDKNEFKPIFKKGSQPISHVRFSLNRPPCLTPNHSKRKQERKVSLLFTQPTFCEHEREFFSSSGLQNPVKVITDFNVSELDVLQS